MLKTASTIYRGDAGEGRRDEVVARGGLAAGAGARRGEGALEARLEEEEGGPAGGVADEVGRQAAVERGEGPVVCGEGAQERDGRGARRRRRAAAVDFTHMRFPRQPCVLWVPNA